MRASLLLLPLLLSCGGGTTSGGAADPKPVGQEVTTGGTRGFDEYPQEYGADAYGDFYYDGYDGYEGGYSEGYGGMEYGGDWAPPPPVAPDVTGTWRGGCEPGAKDSKKLSFVISATRWDLDYETFGDTTCTKRTARIQLGGPYSMGEPSTTVTGAWHSVFSFDVRDLTADDAKTAKAMGKLCGIKKLKAGVATSLLEKGCAKLGFKPLADCGGDFDLVAVEGFALRFGVRPADNDLCTEAKRPTALEASHQLGFVWPSTGVPECDAYFTLLDSYVKCPAAASMMTGDILTAFRGMISYMKDASTCQQYTDATKQAIAGLGC